MFKDFRTFILRGNVVDLAVGVAIGAAFSSVVTALVKDIITPLTAIFGAEPNFSALTLTVGHAKLAYGDVINALVSFLLMAVTIYFLVVRPVNVLMGLRKTETAPQESTRDC